MKKTQLISAFAMILLSAGFLFSFAQNKITPHTLSIYDIFDTYCEITILAGKNSGKVLSECNEYLHKADRLWSDTNADSEISAVNAQAGKAPVKISDETFDILDKCLKYSADTNGYFDITVGALSKLWDIGGENQHVPPKEEISEAIHCTGFSFLELDKSAKTAFITKDGACITLGAAAKGYAASELCTLLKNENITSGLINLGGNIYSIGKQSDGKPWNIAVQDPADSDNIIGTLNLFDTSVITSGSYIRYFEENGTKYHHILNPFTGMPANTGLLSVTIISPDACLADVLSTACFVIGYKESLPLIRESGVSAIFVTEDNTVYYSKGLENNFIHDNPRYEYKTFE